MAGRKKPEADSPQKKPRKPAKKRAKPPKRPRTRPTEPEAEEREDFVYRRVCLGKFKSTIRKSFEKKFGPISHVCFGTYLTRARARVNLAVKEAKGEQRCESLAFYRAMRAAAGDERDRLKAQERIDKLLGLEIHLPMNPETLLELLGIRTLGAAGVSEGQLPPEPVSTDGASAES